jgi:hypothetical protein
VRLTVTTVIVMLSLAGIAFNVRFLVALRKEYKAVLSERPVPERRGNNKPAARAA